VIARVAPRHANASQAATAPPPTAARAIASDSPDPPLSRGRVFTSDKCNSRELIEVRNDHRPLRSSLTKSRRCLPCRPPTSTAPRPMPTKTRRPLRARLPQRLSRKRGRVRLKALDYFAPLCRHPVRAQARWPRTANQFRAVKAALRGHQTISQHRSGPQDTRPGRNGPRHGGCGAGRPKGLGRTARCFCWASMVTCG
jgi:hypothetical protein